MGLFVVCIFKAILRRCYVFFLNICVVESPSFPIGHKITLATLSLIIRQFQVACNTRQIRLFPHKPFNLIAGGENVEKSESTKNHHFEASRMDLQASPVRRRFRMWRRKYVLGPSWTSDEKSFLCWSVTQHRCNVYVQKGTLEKINWTLPLVIEHACISLLPIATSRVNRSLGRPIDVGLRLAAESDESTIFALFD